MSWSAPMLIENLRYMSANCTVEVSEAGGAGREGGGGGVDVGEHVNLVFSLNIRASLGVIVCEQALHLGERSEPRECDTRERTTKPREAFSPPPPLSRFPSRATRACTFCGIPQMESLLAGYRGLGRRD